MINSNVFFKILIKGVIIISISLLFLIVLGVIVLLMFVVPAFISDKNSEGEKKPYTISWAILGLLVLNWLLFLPNSYSLMPASISHLIFPPIWVILSIEGSIHVIQELKKNEGLAVSLAGLTTISLLFNMLVYGIGEM